MMRKGILFVMMAVLLCGCGANCGDNAAERTKPSVVHSEPESTEKESVASQGTDVESENEEDEKETADQNRADEDAFFDYTEQIKQEVSEAISSAGSLQEELKKIEKVSDKYEKRFREEDGSQSELNSQAQWSYLVWDMELNDIWKRMKNSLAKDTMTDLLKEQRRWVANKEEVVNEAVSDYEGGSIQPMMYQLEMTSVTRNRVYQLAFLLAESKGETFEMPKRAEIGDYIDDQGTGNVYSSLIIKYGLEGTERASIGIYRLGSADGTVKKDGDTLLFEGTTFQMTGKISYSWDGATFEVLSAEEGPFKEGDVFEFPTAF